MPFVPPRPHPPLPKYSRKLLPLLERLHDDGCARAKAGNRRLHVDQSCTLILLSLFNPVVVSLRSLQPASEEELLAQSVKRPPQPSDS